MSATRSAASAGLMAFFWVGLISRAIAVD